MLIASPFFSVLCRREGSAAHTKTEYKRRKKKKKKKPVPEKKKKINKTSPLGINVCSKSDTIRPCCRIG